MRPKGNEKGSWLGLQWKQEVGHKGQRHKNDSGNDHQLRAKLNAWSILFKEAQQSRAGRGHGRFSLASLLSPTQALSLVIVSQLRPRNKDTVISEGERTRRGPGRTRKHSGRG